MSLVCVFQASLRVHPVKFAGASVKDKIKQIRKELKGDHRSPRHVTRVMPVLTSAALLAAVRRLTISI